MHRQAVACRIGIITAARLSSDGRIGRLWNSPLNRLPAQLRLDPFECCRHVDRG